MPTGWIVVHAHYKGEPPERSDFNASFDEENKAYKCPKCRKFVAGIQAGRRKKLYILRKDVMVDVG